MGLLLLCVGSLMMWTLQMIFINRRNARDAVAMSLANP
jgi:hypothetical protein